MSARFFASMLVEDPADANREGEPLLRAVAEALGDIVADLGAILAVSLGADPEALDLGLQVERHARALSKPFRVGEPVVVWIDVSRKGAPLTFDEILVLEGLLIRTGAPFRRAPEEQPGAAAS